MESTPVVGVVKMNECNDPTFVREKLSFIVSLGVGIFAKVKASSLVPIVVKRGLDQAEKASEPLIKKVVVVGDPIITKLDSLVDNVNHQLRAHAPPSLADLKKKLPAAPSLAELQNKLVAAAPTSAALVDLKNKLLAAAPQPVSLADLKSKLIIHIPASPQAAVASGKMLVVSATAYVNDKCHVLVNHPLSQDVRNKLVGSYAYIAPVVATVTAKAHQAHDSAFAVAQGAAREVHKTKERVYERAKTGVQAADKLRKEYVAQLSAILSSRLSMWQHHALVLRDRYVSPELQTAVTCKLNEVEQIVVKVHNTSTHLKNHVQAYVVSSVSQLEKLPGVSSLHNMIISLHHFVVVTICQHANGPTAVIDLHAKVE